MRLYSEADMERRAHCALAAHASKAGRLATSRAPARGRWLLARARLDVDLGGAAALERRRRHQQWSIRSVAVLEAWVRKSQVCCARLSWTWKASCKPIEQSEASRLALGRRAEAFSCSAAVVHVRSSKVC